MCILRWSLVLSLLVTVVLINGCSGSAQVSVPVKVADDGKSLLKDYLMQESVVEAVTEWNSPCGDGFIIQTKHYEVYTTMTDMLMLRQLPSYLESLNCEYRKVSKVNAVSANRYILYLFETREQWEQFGEVFAEELWPIYQKIEKGAYYLNGACVAYNIGRTDTFAIVAHEGWHQFSHRHFKYRMPAWLDEGLAMQFEGSKKQRGKYVFSPSYNQMRMQGVKRSHEQGHEPSLVSLLTGNPAVIIDDDAEDASEKVSAYYSRVYALVRFLNEYGGGVYKPTLQAMITSLADGSWEVDDEVDILLKDRNNVLTTTVNRQVGVKLFSDYYGRKVKEIDEQFTMYCYYMVLNESN